MMAVLRVDRDAFQDLGLGLARQVEGLRQHRRTRGALPPVAHRRGPRMRLCCQPRSAAALSVHRPLALLRGVVIDPQQVERARGRARRARHRPRLLHGMQRLRRGRVWLALPQRRETPDGRLSTKDEVCHELGEHGENQRRRPGGLPALQLPHRASELVGGCFGQALHEQDLRPRPSAEFGRALRLLNLIRSLNECEHVRRRVQRDVHNMREKGGAQTFRRVRHSRLVRGSVKDRLDSKGHCPTERLQGRPVKALLGAVARGVRLARGSRCVLRPVLLALPASAHVGDASATSLEGLSPDGVEAVRLRATQSKRCDGQQAIVRHRITSLLAVLRFRSEQRRQRRAGDQV
mmetsp:Transcript_638/g.2405  ORF Transcript_638/g.2405 Transcript_638/m.2405 type:complete len:349 (-) Transcript_638:2410-3456(-)